MKKTLPTLLLILVFSACTTTYHTHYNDPNYMSAEEFSSHEDLTATYHVEQETIETDSSTTINNYYGDYYEADDYYDFSYSSRIRRFHRPMWSVGYYSGFYTDYYWYNHDPFYCGTSIYYGYNWHSPYYSYYSYSPYYSHCYTPYYYGGYNSYYGQYNYYPTYTTSYTNNNTYSYGYRGSLSSRTNRNVKHYNYTNTNNIGSKHSTVHIRNKTNLKSNIPVNKDKTVRSNSTTKNISNKSPIIRSNSSSRTNTNNRKYIAPKSNNRSSTYSAPKSNSRSYKSNSNSGSSRSYNNSKSSGNSSRSSSGKRSVKPRK